MAVVFVHGAGRAGEDAWPHQVSVRELDRVGGQWEFLTRRNDGDDAGRDADRAHTMLTSSGGGHLVAHSYGGNAALLVAQRDPSVVRSLVLFEPACLDLARGGPAVEQHIRAMAPVLRLADDPSVTARETRLGSRRPWAPLLLT